MCSVIMSSSLLISSWRLGLTKIRFSLAPLVLMGRIGSSLLIFYSIWWLSIPSDMFECSSFFDDAKRLFKEKSWLDCSRFILMGGSNFSLLIFLRISIGFSSSSLLKYPLLSGFSISTWRGIFLAILLGDIIFYTRVSISFSPIVS